jgi:hypothetical protein
MSAPIFGLPIPEPQPALPLAQYDIVIQARSSAPSRCRTQGLRAGTVRQQYTEHPDGRRVVPTQDLWCKRPKDSMLMDTTTNTTDRKVTDDRTKRLVTSGLHPRVWAAMIALSSWFVVWVWSFFSAGAGVVGYLLFVVSGFIGVVIALQLILSSVRRPTEIPNPNTQKDDTPSFHDWIRGDFDTEHGRLGSAQAATIILLSFAAAAIGMMVFGIEFQIVEHASA